MTDPYERLANAVILQAVRDYRTALCALHSYKGIGHELVLYEKLVAEGKVREDVIMEQKLAALRRARADKTEIEEFFHSPLYSILTDVDGEIILKRLQEEVDRK